MSIPLLPGYRRDAGGRGQFAKSHTLGRSDVALDPRSIVPTDSFSGTGAPKHVGPSVVPGARGASASSGQSNFSTTQGRLGAGVPEVERAFADTATRATQDRHAHLRRAPVARDYEATAEPSAHLPVLGPSRLPSWVEYDRKVLRFSGFYKEAGQAVALNSEPYRVRPILLYYWLEDDSMQITEPNTANSGLAQGVIVRRHRVPKDAAGGMFGVEDLWIGAELPVYGRRYRLTGADNFTRAFFEQNGAPLEQDEQTPQDPFARRTAPVAATDKRHNIISNPLTRHAEAALGKQEHRGIKETQQFLSQDGKVLRFYAVWDDTASAYGEKRPYIVHFYLGDDTTEVREISQPNAGRLPCPYLLKRSKLPRDHTRIRRDVAHVGGMLPSDEDGAAVSYIREEDLRVGGTLDVYGRQLVLVGADAYTQRHYIRKFGMRPEDFAPLPHMAQEEEAPEFSVAPPPPTGFGSEEDSLGSFLYLVPRAPKSDQKKLFELDGVLLRFNAQFLHPAFVDRERRFVITYYLANDTMQIFETFDRNLGHVAGKWQDRQRIRNPASPTGAWFGPQDLYLGATIEVNKTKFILLKADEYTSNFQAANPAIWNAEKGNLPNQKAVDEFTGGQPFLPKAHPAVTSGRPF